MRPGLWARSLAFGVAFATLMAAMGLLGAPVVLWRERWCRAWQKAHNRAAFWLLARLCGLSVEVRGPVPDGAVIVAAKHESLLDVLVLYNALPEARFAMKRSLLWVPIFGLYAWRTGGVPIDRSRGRDAFSRLESAFQDRTGQAVVYPQGTRVPPGHYLPYRTGAARLGTALGRPIVPAATNAGLFWPRRGLLRRPGVAVVEFLPPPPEGAGPAETTAAIERAVEIASARLRSEAGFRTARP
ncbi:MAG: lysophospholipid acyltransferase family protein [Paracoccaceae bacterium]